MTYVEPPDFVPGTPAAADDVNILSEDIRDLDARARAQTYMAVSVHRSANLSVPDSVYTTVPFQTADLDEGNWWVSGTDITVPDAAVPPGYVDIAIRVLFHARFASNATGLRSAKVFVNGSGGPSTRGPSLSGDQTSITGFDARIVSAGDIITIGVYQSSGGALNLNEIDVLVERAGPIA